MIGNFWGGITLLLGCIGQYLSGRIAKTDQLEKQLLLIAGGTIPCLILMAFCPFSVRPIAAGLFAIIFFMHQPVQSSLVAHYTPRQQRSFCYGIMFALANGVGAIGALIAGYSTQDEITYSIMAISMSLATFVNVVLWLQRKTTSPENH